MNKKLEVNKIILLLKKEYPDAKCSLNFATPFELLVSVILSAQCTDERVNKTTPKLFKRFPSVNEFATAEINELEQYVRSTGFYRNKAKNLKKMSQQLIKNFNGKVPQDMNDLISLAGVARKTANVILWNTYGINEGIAVDTHVKRLTYRLGLTKNIDPKKIEQDLIKIIPKEYWGIFTHFIIYHGRKICTARKPKCKVCVLKKLCPSAFKF